MFWNHDWGWMWTGGGIVMMVLFWVIVVGAIYWGIKAFSTQGQPETTPQVKRKRRPSLKSASSPEDIVSQRYARGEISRDEYHDLMQDLQDTAYLEDEDY